MYFNENVTSNYNSIIRQFLNHPSKLWNTVSTNYDVKFVSNNFIYVFKYFNKYLLFKMRKIYSLFFNNKLINRSEEFSNNVTFNSNKMFFSNFSTWTDKIFLYLYETAWKSQLYNNNCLFMKQKFFTHKLILSNSEEAR